MQSTMSMITSFLLTELRRSIELIQDFTMPTAATHMELTRDGQYILSAGVYKPRVRCYDTTQLSMKFERCLDSDGMLLLINNFK